MNKYEVIHIPTGEQFLISAKTVIEAYAQVCSVLLDRYSKEKGIDLSRTAYNFDLGIKKV